MVVALWGGGGEDKEVEKRRRVKRDQNKIHAKNTIKEMNVPMICAPP